MSIPHCLLYSTCIVCSVFFVVFSVFCFIILCSFVWWFPHRFVVFHLYCMFSVLCFVILCSFVWRFSQRFVVFHLYSTCIVCLVFFVLLSCIISYGDSPNVLLYSSCIVYSVSFVLFSLFYIAKLWITYCFFFACALSLVFANSCVEFFSVFSVMFLYKWAVFCCLFVCLLLFFVIVFSVMLYICGLLFLFRLCVCGIIYVDSSFVLLSLCWL